MLCGPCAMSADPRLAALEGGWDGGTPPTRAQGRGWLLRQFPSTWKPRSGPLRKGGGEGAASRCCGQRPWLEVGASGHLAAFESCLVNADLSSLSSKPRQGGLHAGLRERLFQLEVLGGLPHLGQDVPGEDQGGGRARGRGVPAGGRGPPARWLPLESGWREASARGWPLLRRFRVSRPSAGREGTRCPLQALALLTAGPARHRVGTSRGYLTPRFLALLPQVL